MGNNVGVSQPARGSIRSYTGENRILPDTNGVAYLSHPDKRRVDQILSKLYPNIATLREIGGILLENMEAGLKKETHPNACVKMFPSYVTKLPTGSEEGKYIALDLGGTNYRVLLVKLLKGKGVELTESAYRIPDDKMHCTGKELFSYIAETLDEFLIVHNLKNEKLSLGFTFSFPCKQNGIRNATLVKWTKGFKVSDVEGNNVAEMLQEAINDRNVNVTVDAVVNDTVGTLASCSLSDPKCAIGFIVGTGTNAAYVENIEEVETFIGEKNKSDQVVINMELGAFGDDGSLDQWKSEFDVAIDKNSINPGFQIFEKMVSGMYLGELVRLVLLKLNNEKILLKGESPKNLTIRNSINTKAISETERDPIGYYYSTEYFLCETVGAKRIQVNDLKLVRYVCSIICTRSAQLCGTAISVIMNKLRRSHVTVGVDGSLFKFHPRYAERMMVAIKELTPSQQKFVLCLSEDGSGKGAAAIVAALAAKDEK